MDFGLRQQDIDEIRRIIEQFSVVEEAIIFGSRAKGNYKKGSDIDIAINGKDISYDVVASLSFSLNEESLMPYYFDVIHLEEISEKKLLEHVNRVGHSIYVRDGVNFT